jgi:rubrerythrin
MESFPGEKKQLCTVLCPECGLVWTMDRLSPNPCPECDETHVVFRGTLYMVSRTPPMPQRLAS